MTAFLFRLALETGHVHPDLLPPLSARQVMELMLFCRREPLGQHRVTHGEAIVAAMIGNAHRGKSTPPFKAEDFLPRKKRKPLAEDPERAAALGRWLKALGKKADPKPKS